jgi:hypothetical protein
MIKDSDYVLSFGDFKIAKAPNLGKLAPAMQAS